MSLIEHLKIGFIGAGNMTQVIASRLFETSTVKPEFTLISNRSPGKLAKFHETWPFQIVSNNEDIVDKCQVVFLAMKPQDFSSALEPIASLFTKDQIVISLLAGIPTESIKSLLPHSRIIRIMPNSPSAIGKGVIGYCMGNDKDIGAVSILEEILSPLGLVVPLDEGDPFNTLLISSSSGSGFILEMMIYWQDWIEDHGFSPEMARKITSETFFGTAALTKDNAQSTFEELQAKVTSKKGVTAAGLESMRELEMDRVLRLSFEKAWMRNQDLSNSK